ncbi:hypothetical protein CAPTEDRAFT_154162 [Capitella teleta]|uniref:Protein jagunal n=1 Tax=Capitella teleta TaxID=283909 RepID=R7V1Q3_CAPTE|nr:hypothetical protein CAPTEDRAFT_154162 [Capitella teleta]|eukprot:ELU12437.1 hypothetical protein CAPTEDRAFT_154162 [Capitella teleta]
MSSNLGPRAVGSDGSDFMHRERVASHYKNSAVYKWRLKFVLVAHFFLVGLMLLRLSVSICVLFHMRPPSFMQKMKLPRAELWEYAWLASVLPTILGLISLPKNRLFLLKQFLIGCVVFGIAPILYAMYTLSDELFEFWETRESKRLLLGFPIVVLWNMFLVIALQIHIFSFSFGWQLNKAWSPKKKSA